MLLKEVMQSEHFILAVGSSSFLYFAAASDMTWDLQGNGLAVCAKGWRMKETRAISILIATGGRQPFSVIQYIFSYTATLTNIPRDIITITTYTTTTSSAQHTTPKPPASACPHHLDRSLARQGGQYAQEKHLHRIPTKKKLHATQSK